MTSLEILCKRSSCEMAADKNEASLAPAESEVEDEDVDVDDVRRSSILKPEKSRPVRDSSLPCIPFRERENGVTFCTKFIDSKKTIFPL